jgi:hypothetical protein
MKATVSLTPNIQLEIEEQNEMMTLHKAIALSSPPTKCNLCGESDIRIETNKDKEGNFYINAVCLGCFAKAKLGLYKTGGYFWHNKFDKYERKENQTTTEAQNDSVPF